MYTVVPHGPLCYRAAHGPDDDGGDGFPKPRWYSITRGRYIGITQDATLARASIDGLSGRFAVISFSTRRKALQHFNRAQAEGHLFIVMWCVPGSTLLNVDLA
jgi:hypothetical protein